MHRSLGPGLLESIYTPCFLYELRARKLQFEAQRSIPITYKGMTFGPPYRIDLIVEGQIVVELKAVERTLGIHEAQVLTRHRLRLRSSPFLRCSV